MRYTPKERRLINYFASRKKAGKTTFSVEQIARVAYGHLPKEDWPPNWRNSVIAQMRLLIIKTSVEKWSLVRSSGLGRGNPARYQYMRNPRDTEDGPYLAMRRREVA
jgi:hypothetical protein